MRYLNKSKLSAIAGAVLVSGVLLAPVTGQARSWDVRDLSNGGFEIEFSNGCVVTYDQYGDRSGKSRDCKNKQLDTADETAKSHHRSNDNSGSSGKSVPEGQMRKYCQGEASAKLDVRPNYLSTDDVERQGNKYVVRGEETDSGTTFKCTFNRDGVFQGVDVKHGGGHGSNDSGDIPNSAKRKCTDRFGNSPEITSVSALRPGYWEVIMQARKGPRSVACTVTSSGSIEDWVELN
jgi:hypothetical protein